MADTYGMNVYDSSGNLKFSLADNILRLIYVGECSSAPWSSGDFNVSVCTKSISSSDLIIIQMPVGTNNPGFKNTGISVSGHDPVGDNPAYTTAVVPINTLGTTKLGTSSTTRILVIGKA